MGLIESDETITLKVNDILKALDDLSSAVWFNASLYHKPIPRRRGEPKPTDKERFDQAMERCQENTIRMLDRLGIEVTRKDPQP